MSYDIFGHCFAEMHDGILDRAAELDPVSLTDEEYCTHSVDSMPASWNKVLQEERSKAEDKLEVGVNNTAARGALFRAALVGKRITLTPLDARFPLFGIVVVNSDRHPEYGDRRARISFIREQQYSVTLLGTNDRPEIDTKISNVPAWELSEHFTPVPQEKTAA